MAHRSNRTFLLVFAAIFLSGISGLFGVFYFFAPQTADWKVLIGIYAGIFLSVCGLAGILGILARSILRVRTGFFELARQSLLLGLIGACAMIFQSLRLLNAYTGLLLVIAAIILELYSAGQESNE